jgi:hypothetical protein
MMIAMFRAVRTQRFYFWVITTIPTATAARQARSATPASTAAAVAASGRSSRERSAKRVAPQIASEKTRVSPMPATVA